MAGNGDLGLELERRHDHIREPPRKQRFPPQLGRRRILPTPAASRSALRPIRTKPGPCRASRQSFEATPSLPYETGNRPYATRSEDPYLQSAPGTVKVVASALFEAGVQFKQGAARGCIHRSPERIDVCGTRNRTPR